MDSSTHRLRQEQQRKDEIAKKIAALQAELAELPETKPSQPQQPKSPKRKRPEPKVLAPETPSPRKKRKTEQPQRTQPISQPVFKQIFNTATKHSRNAKASGSGSQPLPPKPSNVLKNLASVKGDGPDSEPTPTLIRSTSFAEPAVADQDFEDTSDTKRDERLALIQDFEPGPYAHTPPADDPTFERVEPHSNIALKSRAIPHEDFKDHLRGRYYLSPSQLYSSIRLQPDKQHYDVPVPGDWVTIAVVAERGPIKYTRAPVALEPDSGGVNPKDKWKKKKGAEMPKPAGRKYTNMKLIDFGARTKSSATGGKAIVRGDAFLSLLLFEAEAVDIVTQGDNKRPVKVYRGGSGGAFEALEKLKEGDVVALLNPRILKPYQRSSDTPHPVNNILAVTPDSASSIAVIGRARDLGMCTVKKKDGKVCGSWCDKRQSDVCEYHIQNAVQHRRAARPEFTAGTGGMSANTVVKRKNDYDPARQWGLKPSNGNAESAGSTYIVSGHIVRGDTKSSLFMAEDIGREGQAKAKRKLENNDVEKTLKKLLERDREGMEVVLKAREAAQLKAAADDANKGKTTGAGGSQSVKVKKPGVAENSAVAEFNKPKKAYAQSVIRSLGFDPTLKPGHRRIEATEDSQTKREKLEAICASKREIKLGPVPGPRKQSNIVAPPKPLDHSTFQEQHDEPDPSDGHSKSPKEEAMIDLDDF